MTNIIEQQATVVVHGTSRYNENQFDKVIVYTTIITDGPLVDEYYVPNGNSLSKTELAFIRENGLEFRPYRESDLLQGTTDVFEVAKQENTPETSADLARILLRSAITKTPLTLLKQVGNKHVYEVNYEYKLHPLEGDNYEFIIRLPFDGTTMQVGSIVKLAVLTPEGATIDPTGTKGIDENQAEIQEVVQQLQQQNRAITTFHYQIDPIFTIKYTHTQPLLQA